MHRAMGCAAQPKVRNLQAQPHQMTCLLCCVQGCGGGSGLSTAPSVLMRTPARSVLGGRQAHLGAETPGVVRVPQQQHIAARQIACKQAGRTQGSDW